MAVTPESFFFRHFWKLTLRGRERAPAEELVTLFTQGRFTRDLRLDPKLLSEQVGSGEISVMEFFRIALRQFARSRGKSHCAEKTPVHLLYVPQIVQYFPSSRIICIYRDGRDCALSLRKVRYAIPALRGYAARWREFIEAMLKFKDQFSDRFRTVQYESLLVRPQEEIASLMQFVGLDFEPGQLDASRATGVYTDWDLDMKKNVLSEIDPNRAYAWKRSAKSRELRIMNSMMRPYLGQLGYDPGEEQQGTLPVRIYDSAMNAVFRTAFGSRVAEWRRMTRYALRPLVGTSPHVMPLKPVSTARGDASSDCNLTE